MRAFALIIFMLFAAGAAHSQISGHLVVCRGASRTTLTGTPSGGTWTSGDVGRATINSSTGEVMGIAAGTATISYTDPTSTVHTAVVTVNSYVMSSIGFSMGSDVRCTGGATATCTVSPIIGNNWSSSNATIASVNTSGIVTPGTTTGTVVISYRHGYGNCYVTRNMTVTPTPTVSMSGTVCAGSTQTAIGTPSGGTWMSTNTSVGTINSSTGVLTALTGGGTYIRYTLGTCLTQPYLLVSAPPAAISGITTICVGNSATLTSATSGGTWSSTDPSVATIGSSTGVVTGVTTGTTTISYIVGSGCFRTAVVTVNAAASTSTGPDEVCMGQTITVANSTGGGTWSSSNTSRATVTTYTGVVTGVSAGTVNISYRIGGGCTTIKTVTVNGTMASITGGPNVCEGASVSLSHSMSGGTWVASNANATIGATTGVMTGVTAGAVNITYTASPGCVKVQMMTVKSTPAAITGTLTVCPGATTALSSASGGGTWSSGNTLVATVSSTGIVTGISGGTATITYTVASWGCFTTAVVTVASTGAGISGGTTLCLGSSVTLVSSPAGGVWSSSNMAVANIGSSSGLVSALTPGTSVISYVSGTGACTSTVTLVVEAAANAGTIIGPASVDVGDSAMLSDSVGGGVWSSSNTGIATVSSVGVVSAIATGSVGISYSVTNSCGTVSAVRTIDAVIGEILGIPLVCPGTTTMLSSASTGGSWESANTSVATIGSGSGIVTGVSSGTVNITYHLGGSYLVVVATVSAIPDAGLVTGALITTVDGTTGLSSSVSGGSWSSSDITIATVGSTGIVAGIAPGTATISYTVTNSCGTAQAVRVVTVSIAAIGGSLTVCTGSATVLSSTSSGGTWSSSAVAVATIGSETGIATGLSEGTTTITYSLAGSFVTSVLTVNHTADAGSLSGPAIVQVGATATLSGTVTGGTWSSSNAGIASVGSTGVVTGITDGTATIYYIKTASCAPDTAMHTITVYTIASGKPTVSTMSASSGNYGTTLTITGSNFCSVASFNSVWFGSVKGVVTAASASSLSVTIPTGGQVAPIQITNLTNGLSGYSQQNFLPTFDTSAYVGISPNFDTALALSLPGEYGTGMAIGDLDNDGKPEVIGTSGSSGITIFRNNATPGSLSSSSFSSFDVSSVGACYDVAVHDVDGDGKADIIYSGSPGLYILRNIHSSGSLSTSSFSAPIAVSSSYVGAPYIDDVDGDGKPDILALAGSSLNVLRNIGTPGSITTSSFASAVGFSVNSSAVSLSIGDIDGDGKKDVAVVSYPSSNLSILRNNSTSGAISYNAKYDLPAAASDPYGVAVGDLTMDGKPEVVVSCLHDYPGSYYANAAVPGAISSASFPTMLDITVGYGYGLSIGLGDFNGDSRLDAVVGDDWGNRALVSLNKPLGDYALFDSYSDFPLTGGTYPKKIVTGDIDGDGKPDIIACKLFGSKLVILRNSLAPRVFGADAVCVGASTTYSVTAAGTSGTWSSLNTAVATIGSASGIITGVAPGTATIRFAQPSGVISARNITVNPFGGYIVPYSTVAVGATISLGIFSGTSGGTWSSSNSAIATVGSTGVVTGVSAGSVIISYTVEVDCGTAVSTRTLTVTGSKPAGNLMMGEPNLLCIFPNPSTGIVNVQAGSDGVLNVTTIDGRILTEFQISSGLSAISLPERMTPGIYLLKFLADNGSVQTLRLVYER